MIRPIISLLSLIFVLPLAARTTPASRLKARLVNIEKQGVMFGHQDDTFYGHTWQGSRGRSDVLETAGDYPAVTGWLLAAFVFEANGVQNAETLQGIRMFLSILPAAGALLSALFIAAYPLSEKRMREITKELELKRAQQQ